MRTSTLILCSAATLALALAAPTSALASSASTVPPDVTTSPGDEETVPTTSGTTKDTDGATTTTTVSTAAPTTLLREDETFDATVAALAFGLLAIVGVLWFLAGDRRKSRETLERLAARGPVAETSTPAMSEGLRTLIAPAPPYIDGRDKLVVGESETYTYIAASDSDPVAGLKWSATGSVTVPDGASGAAVDVTAVRQGAATLTAQPPGSTEPSTKVIEVEQPGGRATALSSLGEGWGSVTAAIAILSVTAALGFAGTLNGQAVAGIIGALVTYAIVRRADT